ncbi:hypothetical protein [Acinetobacter nectaris]|uniref:hypothetical protein n=1 Tax=Acinetobacter nectaris TaxID=1219382 RepID=UPI001F2955BB|nr:hypothetical protein [Acinetobacter nectaris]MCF9046196.1 hypothetical protein [Acinetobacter nectaris]
MRGLIGVMSLVVFASLTGCGQPGALQLTNDPHLDKRPKYLLWHNKQGDVKSDEASIATSEPLATPRN